MIENQYICVRITTLKLFQCDTSIIPTTVTSFTYILTYKLIYFNSMYFRRDN